MTSSPWSGRDANKDQLRNEIWSLLASEQAVHDDPVGAIPDFIGAEEAAERLATTDVWTNARVVKCTPDRCQEPIRKLALEQGKLLYMAYPRLAIEPCFIELDPEQLTADNVDFGVVATMDGAIEHGRPVPFEEMRHIDLINVGCVAVSRAGGRTGKGAGFADLEVGLLRQFGIVDANTPIATTVHPLSLVDDDRLPMRSTDSPLKLIVTVDETIETGATGDGPAGIDWDLIQDDQLRDIPVLARLAAEQNS